eukprot:scaffold3341_cov317-Prasinococcus_capsulatus_cf.AAC.3
MTAAHKGAVRLAVWSTARWAAARRRAGPGPARMRLVPPARFPRTPAPAPASKRATAIGAPACGSRGRRRGAAAAA